MPVPLSTVSVLTFGFILGLKHAMEADHLAAVSTIVSERKGVLRASIVGGFWGIGHSLSLLAAGLAMILFHLQIREATARILEFGVAVMLVFLGVRALQKVRRGGLVHAHQHQHGPHQHVHLHTHEDGDTHHAHGLNRTPEVRPDHHHAMAFFARPLIVGMIHGVAGSAALMLLVLSTIASAAVGVVYILVFGIGSTAGMILMSVLVSLPARLAMARFANAQLAMHCLAGLFSLGFGLSMMYEIGFVPGLLSR